MFSSSSRNRAKVPSDEFFFSSRRRHTRCGRDWSSDVCSSDLRQIKTVNPKLNALVENRFAEALVEARQCDELLEQGKAEGRLFGVPISMKESMDVAGMRSTGEIGRASCRERV